MFGKVVLKSGKAPLRLQYQAPHDHTSGSPLAAVMLCSQSFRRTESTSLVRAFYYLWLSRMFVFSSVAPAHCVLLRRPADMRNIRRVCRMDQYSTQEEPSIVFPNMIEPSETARIMATRDQMVWEEKRNQNSSRWSLGANQPLTAIRMEALDKQLQVEAYLGLLATMDHCCYGGEQRSVRGWLMPSALDSSIP